MSNLALNIENVSKKYMIGRDKEARYETLRDRISHSLKAFAKGNLQGQTQEFWALQDINLKVEHGDKVALIGHNGAGKSTLLKILSQVTEPTTGEITLHGKVSSLLEVGTGFHPELTGRENIFLNGSIMGMSKHDITRQLDEIVEFSGVGDFLETPVKRYSSGMQARLGFAVAAHLQSDILIVDEVLAVGDAAFQKKCLGKMDEVSKKDGKTILFVSHNIGAVKNLCDKAALLNQGRTECFGQVDDVISRYVNDIESDVLYIHEFAENYDQVAQMTKISVCNGNIATGNFGIFDKVTIKIEYLVCKRINNTSFFIEIISEGEVLFCSMEAGEHRSALNWREEGRYETFATIPAPLLRTGSYMVNIYMGTPLKKPIHEAKACLRFSIHNDLLDTDYSSYSPQRKGKINVPLVWKSNINNQELES